MEFGGGTQFGARRNRPTHISYFQHKRTNLGWVRGGLIPPNPMGLDLGLKNMMGSMPYILGAGWKYGERSATGIWLKNMMGSILYILSCGLEVSRAVSYWNKAQEYDGLNILHS